MIYLYKITNQLNGKVYIGQSNKEKERWRQHKYFGRNPDKTNQYIHKAMNKYGIDNFTYEVICTSLTQEDANEAEKQLIIQYDSRNKEKGYNLAPGGDSAWNTGLPAEQQPMYGKHHSEDSRKKISESNIGKLNPHSDEWREKASKAHKGRPKTEEWKKKISQSNLGVKRSLDTRQAMSEAKLGSKLSEETKEKMSIPKKGKAKSDDTRQKMSKSKIKLSFDKEIELIKYYNEGMKNKELSSLFEVSIPTIYAIIKRHANALFVPCM
jgi:group I intron endonuclease